MVEMASVFLGRFIVSFGNGRHFALGNTNTLATIDVAGAFIVETL